MGSQVELRCKTKDKTNEVENGENLNSTVMQSVDRNLDRFWMDNILWIEFVDVHQH